jgi:uncharacterized hydrophobic protein (TIGR00271 family)
MIALEVFGESRAMDLVAERLDELDGVRRVRIEQIYRAEHSVVMAHVAHDATDRVLHDLEALGVSRENLTLTRVEELGGGFAPSSAASLIWADVIGLAGSNARLIGRYLALMAVAGTIACYGVIDTSAILVVGAMAVSPDLLPITATAVGVVGRSPRLVGRALVTLAVGMAVTAGVAAVIAFAQNHLSLLPSDFNLGASVLQGLVHVDNETIVVAFVAGIAGMLAFETRASAGVGVAISVTTIPAAAYLGVATGLGEADKALGALAVLSTNVAMIVLGAVVTLIVQRRLRSRGLSRRSNG